MNVVSTRDHASAFLTVARGKFPERRGGRGVALAAMTPRPRGSAAGGGPRGTTATHLPPEHSQSRLTQNFSSYAARDRRRHRARGTQLAAACKQCGAEFAYVSTTKPRLYCFACSPRGAQFMVGEPA